MKCRTCRTRWASPGCGGRCYGCWTEAERDRVRAGEVLLCVLVLVGLLVLFGRPA